MSGRTTLRLRIQPGRTLYLVAVTVLAVVWVGWPGIVLVGLASADVELS